MAQHEQGMETWRNEFQSLDWSRGWSREDLQQRFSTIPASDHPGKNTRRLIEHRGPADADYAIETRSVECSCSLAKEEI